MDSEKRMVSTYEIIASMRVGEKEVLLGADEKNTEGEKYFCGFARRDGLLETYSECVVSDDYLEIVGEYGRRITNEAELFRESVRKLNIPIAVIMADDCIPDHYGKDINGKVVAIKAEVLRPEYQRADRQIVLVTGGFGASANSRGSAVFCIKLHTGEHTRIERREVLGEVKPECMPEWAAVKAELFRHSLENPKVFEYGGKQFCPFRRLTSTESSIYYAMRHSSADNSLGMQSKDYPNSKYPYSHAEFYEKSSAKNCDLFVCLNNGKLYLPSDKELFEWQGDIRKPDRNFTKEAAQKPKRKEYER